MSLPCRTARPRARLARSITIAAIALLGALPAAAQQGPRVRVNAKDSVSFVVPRRAPADGELALRTIDRWATLILRDTVVVLQLTDHGMDHLFDDDTTTRGVGGAILARMMRAGITGLLDHGIAYRLSALRAARVDRGVLVLEDAEGGHVFEDTEYNGRRPMHEFAPEEAERFAAAVQRAIARQSRR